MITAAQQWKAGSSASIWNANAGSVGVGQSSPISASTKLAISGGDVFVTGAGNAANSNYFQNPNFSTNVRVGSWLGHPAVYGESSTCPTCSSAKSFKTDLLLGASSGNVRIGGLDSASPYANNPNNLIVDGGIVVGEETSLSKLSIDTSFGKARLVVNSGDAYFANNISVGGTIKVTTGFVLPTVAPASPVTGQMWLVSVP